MQWRWPILALCVACGAPEPQTKGSPDSTTSTDTDTSTTSTSFETDTGTAMSTGAHVTWPCVPISLAAQGTGSWTVTSAPAGAEVVFDLPSSPTSPFQADLPGAYTLDFAGQPVEVEVAPLVVTDPGEGTGAPVAPGPLALRDAITLAQECPGPHEVLIDLDEAIHVQATLSVQAPALPALFAEPYGLTVDTDHPLTLTAAPGRSPTLTGDGTTRLFEVRQVHLVVDGVDLVDGRADDGFGGGAVRLLDGAALTLRDLTLRGHHSTTDGGAVVAEQGDVLEWFGVEAHDNHADGNGGTLALWSGAVTIEDSDLHDNVAGGRGGAVFAREQVWVASSSLTHNEASDGGAIATEAWVADLGTLTLSDNLASHRGGAVHFGDPITPSPLFGLVSATIEDSVIEGNRSEDDGGAVYGVRFASYHLRDTELVANTAGGRGGAVALDDGAMLTDVRFAANEAEGDGGGLFVTAGWDYGNLDFAMTDVSFIDNTAGGNGGGASVTGPWQAAIQQLVATGNLATADGGAVHLSGIDDVSVAGGEVAENHADGNGGGLSLVSASVTPVIVGPTGPFDQADLDLWIHDNTASGNGGGVHLVRSTARLWDAAIEGNDAGVAGGGVCNVDADLEMTSGVQGNAPDDFCDPGRVVP